MLNDKTNHDYNTRLKTLKLTTKMSSSCLIMCHYRYLPGVDPDHRLEG